MDLDADPVPEAVPVRLTEPCLRDRDAGRGVGVASRARRARPLPGRRAVPRGTARRAPAAGPRSRRPRTCACSPSSSRRRMQPASTMTRTPAEIGSSPGMACGVVPSRPRRRRPGRRGRPRLHRGTRARPTRRARARCDREPLFGERCEDLVGERTGAAHGRELGVVLHRADRLDESRGRDGVDARLLQQPIPDVRQVGLLERDAAPGDVLGDADEEVALRLDEVDAFDLAPARRVAEVREQRRRRIRLDEERSVRAVEPGQVAHVRLPAEHVRRAGDEQRLLEERREPLDPRHASLLGGEELERLAVSVGPLADDSLRRRRPRGRRSAATPRARRCWRGAPRRRGR